MNGWTQHALRKLLRAAHDEGIALNIESKPTHKPRVRWAICSDSIDPKQVGCVQVLLPRWLSIIWLWWNLPRESFRTIRGLMKKT